MRVNVSIRVRDASLTFHDVCRLMCGISQVPGVHILGLVPEPALFLGFVLPSQLLTTDLTLSSVVLLAVRQLLLDILAKEDLV